MLRLNQIQKKKRSDLFPTIQEFLHHNNTSAHTSLLASAF